MDPHSDRGKEPLRRTQPPSPEPQQQLTHRISNISEITDIDVNPYAVTTAGLSSPPLHSTVSHDSLGTSYGGADVDGSGYTNEEHSYVTPSPVSTSSWSHRSLPLYASSSGRYAPLSGQG